MSGLSKLGPFWGFGSRFIGVVVKIMVSFWVLNILRKLIFRVPQKGTRSLTTAHRVSGIWGFPKLGDPNIAP